MGKLPKPTTGGSIVATKVSFNDQPLSKWAAKPFSLASSSASAIQPSESDAGLLRLGAQLREMWAAFAVAEGSALSSLMADIKRMAGASA